MTKLGKYTLVRKLAAGGMAEVFLARIDGPAGFSKLQVVKRILPHLSDNQEFVSMFVNEARLAALLNHPNIIQIFELGKEEGTYFIAMELVEGTNLRALARAAFQRAEFLPYPVVLKIISLACEGLAFAHDFIDEAGRPLELVHRDISPDNLLISRQGAVKVADFGIAKAANLPQVTKTGTLKGKISYMAPEQLKELPLDRRADVFALGIVLFEALAAVKPFASASDVSAMQAILNDPPFRLAAKRSDLPAELQPILDRALAKDPASRYPDARAMQADLDHLLVAQGASIRPFDIASVVARYVPLVPLASEPSLPTAPPRLSGTSAGIPAPSQLEASAAVVFPEVAASHVAGGLAPAESSGPAPQQTLVSAPPVIPEVTGQVYAATSAVELGLLHPAGQSRSRWILGGLAAGLLAAVGGLVFRAASPPTLAPQMQIAVPRPQEAPTGVAAVAAVAAPEAATPTRAEGPRAPEAAPPAPGLAPTSPPVQKAEAPVEPQHLKRVHPAKVPTAATAEPGSLTFRVSPWAEVEIDGKSYGPTPMPEVKLPAGLHQVRLTNAKLKADRTLSVKLEPGGQQMVRVNLAVGE